MTQLTIDDLVNREVNCCLSSLVSTLAAGWRGSAGTSYHDGVISRDLQALAEQASELFQPLEDWEEAALQAGWTGPHTDRFSAVYFEDSTDKQTWAAADWESLCRDQNIEAYQREVFEHWSVSPWLARQLEAKGERVDMDFAAMHVWARTTSGQGIASDSVILAIYNEMMAPKVEAGR